MNEGLPTFEFSSENMIWRDCQIDTFLELVVDLDSEELTNNLRSDFLFVVKKITKNVADVTLGDVIEILFDGAAFGLHVGFEYSAEDREELFKLFWKFVDFFHDVVGTDLMVHASPVEKSMLNFCMDKLPDIQKLLNDDYLENFPGDFVALNLRATVALLLDDPKEAEKHYTSLICRAEGIDRQQAAFLCFIYVYLPELISSENECKDDIFLSRYPDPPYDHDKICECLKIVKETYEAIISKNGRSDVIVSFPKEGLTDDFLSTEFTIEDIERWMNFFGPVENLVEFKLA